MTVFVISFFFFFLRYPKSKMIKRETTAQGVQRSFNSGSKTKEHKSGKRIDFRYNERQQDGGAAQHPQKAVMRRRRGWESKPASLPLGQATHAPRPHAETRVPEQTDGTYAREKHSEPLAGNERPNKCLDRRGEVRNPALTNIFLHNRE